MFDFTAIVLREAHAASVALTVETLAAATTLASRLGTPRPRWRVLCAGEATVPLSGGMSIAGRHLPARAKPESSLWIVPGLGLNRASDVTRRLQAPDARAAVRAVRAHVQAGGTVAASCSAVFLLHAAGVLDGRRATTTWWLAPHLRQAAPACTVDADRMVIHDGPVVTAGAALAQADLMLHVLRMRLGAPLADAVARMMLMDARTAQSPYVVPALLAAGNTLATRLTDLVEQALPEVPSIAALAHSLCTTARTLSRHVVTATGQGPKALVQRVRLNRARALLESSRLSVDEVAARVGYADATALRRLLRKSTGATPQQFRAAHHSPYA